MHDERYPRLQQSRYDLVALAVPQGYVRNMANLVSVSKYPQFALYLALILGH